MKYIFGLILLMLAQAVRAQCPVISGRILDGTSGEFLVGATLQSLIKHGTGTGTDSEGRFSWSFSSRDSIRISFIGYKELILVIGDSCEIEIQLYPEVAGLEEIVIRSERLIAEEFSVLKLRKLDIYTNPSARADPLLAVNASPSATTVDESANISLRGGSPEETGIFLNNVPINDAVRYGQLNGIGTFSIFNTAITSQVQVFPGNPPLEFGNTTSGLVALTTDELIPMKRQQSLTVSMANYSYFTSRKIGKSSSFIGFTNYQPSAIIRWFNPIALERVKRFTSADAGLHFFSRLNNKTVLKVFNYTNRESFIFDSRLPTYRGNLNQHKTRNYTVTNLRYRVKNHELSYNSGISFSNAQFHLSTLNIRVKLNDWYNSLNYQIFGNSGELKAGISYDYRHAGLKGQFPQYDYAIGEQYPVDSVSGNTTIRLPEAYAYGKLNLSSRWVAGGGIRRGFKTGDQPAFISMQANLNYRPAHGWNIILSAGRYNKLIIPQNNQPDIEHIYSDQYSLDINLNKSNQESALSVFFRDVNRNDVNTKVKGIEYFWRYRFSPTLRTQVSLTSLHAQEKVNGETSPSRYDIRYFVRGNIELKFAGTWTTTLVFLFRQGSFYRPVTDAEYVPELDVFKPSYGNLQRLPAYNLIDLSISKLFMIKDYSAVAFFSVNNLPNFENVRAYSYNFDYTEKIPEFFSFRVIYFGMIINF
ncbi:MAG: TonB-dependent receptor [Cyclobacteriaceae bacterium]|nr:TonB-dependent receptor [Cyclobacteriaceae bacterium]